MDYDVMLLFACAWGLGGVVHGLSGFGGGLIAMPILVMGTMDIRIAAPVCTIMAFLLSTGQSRYCIKHVAWRRVYPVIIGSLPGAFAGIAILNYCPLDYIRAGLGVFLVAYGAWGLFGNMQKRGAKHPFWLYFTGFLATSFGTAFSFNGPPLAVYTSISGWDRESIRMILPVLMSVTGLIIILVQAYNGIYTQAMLAPLAGGIPAGLIGILFGVRLSYHMRDTTYYRVIFFVIGLSGVAIGNHAIIKLLF